MLLELWGAGQAEVVEELIQLFLTDTADRIAQLQDAFARRDLDALKRLAHSLKGSSSQMGEDRMAGLARLLEEQLSDAALEQSEPVLADLIRQFASSAACMRAFLRRQGRP
ncbi:MAG TPA: Hpt domain-containing protein [Bryobacteraceae bacterium]|nr:Hpt domain-containing protein [Bryobacteraceae bacterium]